MKNKLLLLLLIISSFAYSQTTSVNRLRVRNTPNGNINNDEILTIKPSGLVRSVSSADLVTPPQGIDDVLSQNQLLSTTRTPDLNGNTLAILDNTNPSFNAVFAGGFVGFNVPLMSHNVGGYNLNASSSNGGSGQLIMNSDGTVNITSSDVNSSFQMNTPIGSIRLNLNDSDYTGRYSHLDVSANDKAFRYNLSNGGSLIFTDDNDIPNKKYIDDTFESSITPTGYTNIPLPTGASGSINYRMSGSMVHLQFINYRQGATPVILPIEIQPDLGPKGFVSFVGWDDDNLSEPLTIFIQPNFSITANSFSGDTNLFISTDHYYMK